MCCCSLVRSLSLSFFRSPRVFFYYKAVNSSQVHTHTYVHILYRFTHTEAPYMCSQLLDRFLSIHSLTHSFIHSFYIFAYVCSVTSEDGMLSYICGGLFVLNIFTVRQFSSKRRSFWCISASASSISASIFFLIISFSFFVCCRLVCIFFFCRLLLFLIFSISLLGYITSKKIFAELK